KCLGKMEDVSRSGRTILFVSHNLSAIRTLCRKCLLLERGSLKLFDEDVAHVVNTYLTADKAAKGSWWERQDRGRANPFFTPISLGVVDSAGRTVTAGLDARSEYWVRLEVEIDDLHPALTIGYALFTDDGTLLYWTQHTDAGDGRRTQLRKGRNCLKSPLPRAILNEGTYRLELMGSLHFIQWLFEPHTDVPTLYLEMRGGPSESPMWMGRRPGLLAPQIEWTSE